MILPSPALPAEEVYRKEVPVPAYGQNATDLIRDAITEVAEGMRNGHLAKGEVVLAEGDYVLEAVPGDESSLIPVNGMDGLTIREAGSATRLIVRENLPNAQGFHRKVIAVHGAKDFVLEDLTIDFAPDARDWVQGI